jgi:hypothetical protein
MKVRRALPALLLATAIPLAACGDDDDGGGGGAAEATPPTLRNSRST